MNSCNFIGRMAKNPELKFSANGGIAITKFTIALPARKKDDSAYFINCTSFNKQAELIAEGYVKGQIIAVTGHLQANNFTKKDGTKVFGVELMVDEFTFTEAKGSSVTLTDDDIPF